MTTEKPNWSEQLNHFRSNSVVLSAESPVLFVERMTEELQRIEEPKEIVVAMSNTTFRVKGIQYFSELFANSHTTTREKLESIFIGGVAYGQNEMALEAYALLQSYSFKQIEVNHNLMRKLSLAVKNERWSGDMVRLDRLEKAAKALGRPLRDRIIGEFATSFAMIARYGQ